MTEPLDDLRYVDEVDVWKGDRRTGLLRREGDDVVWLPDDEGPAAATTLGPDRGEVRASAGSVPPFFAGLLPEGARLTALVAATRTSVDDHLTLLLAVGQDAVGDVRVVPSGATPVDPPVLVDESRRDGLDLHRLFEQAVDPAGVGRDRHALPGVQPKVSASMVSTSVRTSVGPALLKLTPPEYPRLAENENFFLRMAAACGPARARAPAAARRRRPQRPPGSPLRPRGGRRRSAATARAGGRVPAARGLPVREVPG